MPRQAGARNADRGPAAAAVFAAAIVALVSGAWAGFQWRQLWVLRGGAEPFCPLGGDGCASLWDGPFASSVHTWTGVPVAGWGLAWSVVAAVLAALCWRAASRGRAAEPVWSATVAMAVAGVASVLALAAVSVSAGAICTNCLITYILVLVYAGLVLHAARTARPGAWVAGGGLAVAASAAALLALAVPGAATPTGSGHGSAALGEAASGGGPEIATLFARLTYAEQKQVNAARAIWLLADAQPGAVRAVYGPADARFRITTFTDSSCGHCAVFHESLEQLLAALPPDAVSIESRVFPLDQACNTYAAATGHEERCLAARVRLCVEDEPGAFALEGRLHEEWAGIDDDKIYALAEQLRPRDELEACVTNPATDQKLKEDIDLAIAHGIRGTPLVLLNGRRTLPNVAFLYAMVLTGGNADHPAYQELPAPELGP